MTDKKDDDEDKIVPFKSGKHKDMNDMLGNKNDADQLFNELISAINLENADVTNIPGSRQDLEGMFPNLKKMNEKYAFVKSVNGEPRIMEWMYDDLTGQDQIQFIKATDFILRYINESEKGPKGEIITLGKWWLSQSKRREYETLIFEPDKVSGEYTRDMKNGVTKYYYNMWEGFSVKPIKGSWRLTIRHIWKVLCNKDKNKFKYVMRWLAWAVQNPGKRAETAIVFKGKKGAGKGFILTSMYKIFGRHGMVIANREHLTGKFNSHLQNKCFLFADEAYHPGDKEIIGVLKQIITEENITFEAKFLNAKTGRNCLHIAMASNEEWVIPATTDERRFFINEVDSMYAKNGVNYHKAKKYFIALWKEMEGDGLSHMLWGLQNMNLTGFHPRNDIPETKELLHQMNVSLAYKERAILDFLEEGIFPGERSTDGQYIMPAKAFIAYIQNSDPSYRKLHGRHIKEILDKLGVTQGRSSNGRYYVFPSLGNLKVNWNRTICKTDWKDNEEWIIKTSPY